MSPSVERDADTGSWLHLKVARHARVAEGAVALELVAFDGSALPVFEAGAYIDVLTPGEHLRPYSLCQAPSERHRYVIAVQRERDGRGASVALHDRVHVGDALRVRAPRSGFALRAGAVHSVLLGGGIGITPLIAMAEALWQHGAPFELHHVARHAGRAAFHETLRQRPYASRVHGHWTEAHGHPDLAQLLRRAPPGSEVYACGSARFVRAVAQAQGAAGRPAERLHVESFDMAPQPLWRGG